MNILKNGLLISVLTLFFSCTGSDDTIIVDTSAQASDLAGTWKLTEITQEGTTTTDIEGVPISIDFTSFGKNIDAQVIFNQSPNNFASSGNYTSVITYGFLGQSTTQEVPVSVDEFLNTGNWELNKGVMTITQNNEILTANVIELTANKLNFEVEIEQVISTDGFTSKAKTLANMVLTK